MKTIAAVLVYGIIWGAFHFLGIETMQKKVLANQQNYSPKTVHFCQHLTSWSKALISFFVALLVPVLAILGLEILHALGIK